MTDEPLEPWVGEVLRCPVTGAPLVARTAADGSPVLVSCDPARPLAYPVRDGVPVLLAEEARPVDGSAQQ